MPFGMSRGRIESKLAAQVQAIQRRIIRLSAKESDAGAILLGLPPS